MAYQVTITTSNGYRCGCCRHEWTDSHWEDTLEEALEQVPTELVDGEPHPFNGNHEVTGVEVTDGSTGERVAWATARWSSGYGKYSGYGYTGWTGYRPDSGSFEAVYNRDGKRIEDTWAGVTNRLKARQAEKDRKKALADLEDAKRRLAALDGSSSAGGG